MSRVEAIKAHYLRELFRQLGQWASLLEAYDSLSPQQRSNTAAHVPQLGKYLDEQGRGQSEETLMELACLKPGAARGNPTFQANYTPDQRRLSANDLREASEWLERVEQEARAFRRLAPEQRRLAFGESMGADAQDYTAEPEEFSTTDILRIKTEVLRTLGQPVETGASPIEQYRKIVEEFRQLSTEEGRELANFAIELVSLYSQAEIEELVLLLACLVPEALSGLHAEFARHRMFSYVLVEYLGADATARDILIESLESEDRGSADFNLTLIALAWIGDDRVQKLFQKWRDNAPVWRSAVHSPPEQYAQRAAWELTAEGKRRDLFYKRCYPLVPAEEGQAGDQEPVRVITPHEEHCGHCQRQLVTLLDFDLTSPRLAFLGLSGERLRIATCEYCNAYSASFRTEVDCHGKSLWSKKNDRPDLHYRDGEDFEFYSPVEHRLVLAQAPRRPQEALALEEGASQIGGYPTWEQGALYPDCPGCGLTMVCLGQLLSSDFNEDVPGTTYAFVCKSGHFAATVYQQT